MHGLYIFFKFNVNKYIELYDKENFIVYSYGLCYSIFCLFSILEIIKSIQFI
jgi:hypothetical protein